jgi:hypothetical protein
MGIEEARARIEDAVNVLKNARPYLRDLLVGEETDEARVGFPQRTALCLRLPTTKCCSSYSASGAGLGCLSR